MSAKVEEKSCDPKTRKTWFSNTPEAEKCSYLMHSDCRKKMLYILKTRHDEDWGVMRKKRHQNMSTNHQSFEYFCLEFTLFSFLTDKEPKHPKVRYPQTPNTDCLWEQQWSGTGCTISQQHFTRFRSCSRWERYFYFCSSGLAPLTL